MNYFYNAYHHFLTITKHKCEVMKNCFAVGLYRQGLLHDLSKYSWEEFATGVKYYQGNRSPNAAEKEERTFAFIRALLARERAKEQAVRRKRMGHVIREIRERGRVL